MSAQPESRPPAAGASSRSGGRALAWAILERVPTFVDAAELPGDAKYSSKLAAPPGVSTLLISREVLPAGAESGRVECGDGEGNLLVSLRSASAQGGGGRLLVCLPGNGSGEARLLPEVPAHLGVDLDSCFGIVAAASPRPGGCDFVVVQLQRAAPSSAPSSSASSAARHRAICYSSSTSLWSAIHVAPNDRTRQFEARSGEEEEYMEVVMVEEEQQPSRMVLEFEPHTTVSHDAKYEIMFVDLKAGVILVFSPEAATARFVPFPLPDADDSDDEDQMAADEEDVQRAASRRAMACSGGRVLLAEVTRDGGWVTMSRLEGDDVWSRVFKVTADEAFYVTRELARRLFVDPGPGSRVAPGLGPVDPADANKLTFYAPRARIAFTVRVDPANMGSRLRVQFGEEAPATSRGSCLDVVVWRFNDDPAASWSKQAELIREMAGKTKVVASKAIKLLRDNADNLMPIAEGAGGLLAYYGAGPFGAAMVGTAATLVKANKVLGASEDVARRVGDWWTSGKLDVREVKDKRDALRLIEEWRNSGKPNNIRAQIMPGLDQQQIDGIRDFFRKEGAEELLADDMQC